MGLDVQLQTGVARLEQPDLSDFKGRVWMSNYRTEQRTIPIKKTEGVGWCLTTSKH